MTDRLFIPREASQLAILVETSVLRALAERHGLSCLAARHALRADSLEGLPQGHREFLARLEPGQRAELRRAVKWRRAF